MTSAIHIYRATPQPAHCWFMEIDGKRLWVKRNKRHVARCFNCEKLRWMGRMWAHVYYDETKYFCRKGFGCKS